MKKIIFTASILACSMLSHADLIYGKYSGVKKIKGITVINCKAKQNTVCIYVSRFEDNNDSGSWFVQAYDDDTVVLSGNYAKVESEDDGSGGTNVVLTEF